MKQLLYLVGVVCLIATVLPACASQPESTPEVAPEPVFDQAAEEAAIRKAMEENFTTWNAKDVKAHVDLYDEVAAPWEYGGKVTRDWIEKYLTDAFTKQKDAKAEITKEVGIVFVTPDVAIYKYHGKRTGMVDGDGKAMPPTKGLGAKVFVKKGGKWLVAASFDRPTKE